MRFVLIICVLAIFSFSSASAQDQSDSEYFIKPFVPKVKSEPSRPDELLTPEEMEAFERIAEDMFRVPAALRNFLNRPIAKEDFMAQVMRFLRSNGGEAQVLTQDGLAQMKQAALIRARREQLSRFVRYDRNLDAQVTFEEVEATFSEEQRDRPIDPRLDQRRVKEQILRRQEDRLKPFRELDTNKDQVLSYQEMGTLSPQKERDATDRQTSQYQQYLELDPNTDGQLTPQELEKQALAVFALYDKNGDGYVSAEEQETYVKVMKMYGLSDLTSDSSCTLEPVSKDLTLLGIGMHQGLALSTVTAAGQEQETVAVNVNVQDDKTPFYLVVSSYYPVIWRFTGHTDAIKHIAVSSMHQNANQKSGSGVTGIRKDRVTFLSAQCFPYLRDGSRIMSAYGKIRVLMGRFPDAVRIGENSRDIAISQGDVSFSALPTGEPDSSVEPASGAGEQPSGGSSGSDDPVERWNKLHQQRVKVSGWSAESKNPYKISTPKGYDAELWGIFIKHYPAGIAEIDAAEVVSDMPAERYQVLPQMAGLVKLVAEGALVKISKREFLIVRDIPRFPAGLNGGHSAKFVVASGVKVPEGSPGHSCVMMEETGEVVDKGVGCR